MSFFPGSNTGAGFSYCGDRLSSDGIIYIKGPGSALANMDIDCDGAQGGFADDGRCSSSRDTQSVTSFQWILQGYGKGVRDLDANVHPYVVFGNVGSKKGWRTFDPQEYGVLPLSVMAVVCGDKLVRISPLLPLRSRIRGLTLVARSTASGATSTAMMATSR